MNEEPIGTVHHAGLAADVFSTETPGEFRIAYRDPAGNVLEEGQLSGISTYRQREGEIKDRLQELASGAAHGTVPDLGDAGEY